MKIKVRIVCDKRHCSLRLCPFHFINVPDDEPSVEKNMEFQEGCRRKGTYEKLHPGWNPYRKEKKNRDYE